MSVLEMLLVRQQELWWALLCVAAIAWVFRMVRPVERRALRVTWVIVALSVVALAAVSQLRVHPMLATTAMGVAVVLWGLASIHLLATVVFRGALPALGLSVPRIAHDLTFTGFAIAWGFLWLRLSGVDPSQLFTTSAVITAVLAFSMQDTLGNVLGGVTLQLDNSLRVGDWVRLDDVSGRVTDVHWRFTAIETRNRELVMVPNSWLMKNRFTVMRGSVDTPFAWRRAVQFNIESGADPEKVIWALEHAVLDAEIPHVLTVPPPNAILSDVASGYCRYTLRYWLGDPRFDDPGDSSVRVHALAALARAGVRPGVPQEEHLMIKENDNWRAAAGQRDFDRRLEAIRRTELFAQLPAQEQQMLAGHLIHAPFAAGDIITRQGAVAHWLYLIIRGEAKVLVDGPDGRLPVATLHDGDIFGEMGMLTGEARSATVIAGTAVDCYRLDKEGFAQVLQQRPEIAKDMTAIVEARNAQRSVLLARTGQPAGNHGDLLGRILSFFSQRN
ncbi:MAG: mechanosensitive ion channel family protein [Rhodoferax sp.]|nr:mechanosensitive ion channel family protein [Rhodoferax sp.]